MLLIAYTLLIIYARVGLTPLYSMLVLFVDCWEGKLLTKAGLEKLKGDLHQPSKIRYVSISFSVICFISLAYWEGIDFYRYFFCCGTPQAIVSFLHNRIGDFAGEYFPIQWCASKWILNPWMLLIAYTLLIIYARVCLTPLYSMLVLFADCWERKLITQAGLENFNGDLH